MTGEEAYWAGLRPEDDEPNTPEIRIDHNRTHESDSPKYGAIEKNVARRCVNIATAYSVDLPANPQVALMIAEHIRREFGLITQPKSGSASSDTR